MNNIEEWIFAVFSEAALYAFLFYTQMLLRVEGDLWVSSIILWLLLNAAILLCPVVRMCYKQNKPND